MEEKKEIKSSPEEEKKRLTRKDLFKKAGKFALITGPALLVLLTSDRARADSDENEGSQPP